MSAVEISNVTKTFENVTAVDRLSLSIPEGQVAVTWTTRIKDQRLWLYLEWTETGGPAVEPPKRRGFGSRLIEEGVPYELDGEVTHKFPRSGVTCTIDVPLAEETS